jgi:hypothetical protein
MRPFLCLAFLLLPVAAAPDEKPAEDPRRLKPGDAPTPYTAEQIRKACPDGRTDVFRIEAMAGVTIMTMKFAKGDENGVEVETTIAKEDGTPVGNRTTKSAWKDLQAHGSFPEKDTTITEETVEVPGGKFDCLLYTVVQKMEGPGTVTVRMYFAKDRAGPPVKMTREAEGKVITSMALLKHTDPAAEKPADDTKPAGS